MGLNHDWAILGAGVREGDARMRDALRAQDCLSTVIELNVASTLREIIFCRFAALIFASVKI